MQMRLRLLPLAMLALTPVVLGQTIPGAGTQIQQLPAPPVPQQAPPKIRIEESTSTPLAGAASVSVLVTELRITGAHAYPVSELVAIARFTPGEQLTLDQLQVMASRITAHYRKHGYFVARAYLPAQDISNHVVSIAVIEGTYGKVSLHNHSNLSDGLALGLLGGLDSGDAIVLKPLESRLLLLSDVPGVKISSTLVPGLLPGSTDLIVDVAPGRRVTGLVDVDNAGNPYTGEIRVGATVNLNDLAGHGDVLSLRAVTSGSGLRYARASYQMMFGRATAGVAYSRLEYQLGKQFKLLGANGTAEIASVYGSMPLRRSRDTNIYVGLSYEDKRFDDRIDLFPADGRIARAGVASVSLYGNHIDGFGGGGTSAFLVSLSAGSLDIQTPAALAADAMGARSNGHYEKLLFHVSRAQHITDSLSLHAGFTGQLASRNLDPSEKFVLGGMDGIRAYPQGEGFGDQGYLLDVEARLRLSALSARVPGDVHLLGFVDAGRVTINKQPWYAGPNDRSLSAAGVGLSWADPGNFALRTYYAVKLGNGEATSAPDRSGRFWIQAIKYF